MIDEWLHTESEMEEIGRNERERQYRILALNLLVDPSTDALIKAARAARHGSIRGLWHADSWYWWDAHLATHWDASRYLQCPHLRANEYEGDVDRTCGRVWLSAKTVSGLDRLVASTLYGPHFDREGYLVRQDPAS